MNYYVPEKNLQLPEWFLRPIAQNLFGEYKRKRLMLKQQNEFSHG